MTRFADLEPKAPTMWHPPYFAIAIVAITAVLVASSIHAEVAPELWFGRVPTYPAAHAQNVIRGGHTITFDFVTSDSVSAVFAFYKERFVANGWKIAGESVPREGLCKLVLDHPGPTTEFVVLTAIRVTDGITRVNVTSTREGDEVEK